MEEFLDLFLVLLAIVGVGNAASLLGQGQQQIQQSLGGNIGGRLDRVVGGGSDGGLGRRLVSGLSGVLGSGATDGSLGAGLVGGLGGGRGPAGLGGLLAGGSAQSPWSGAVGGPTGRRSGPGSMLGGSGTGMGSNYLGLGPQSGGAGGPNQSSGSRGIPSFVGAAVNGLLGGGLNPGRSSAVGSPFGGNPIGPLEPGSPGQPSIGGSGLPTAGASGPNAFGTGSGSSSARGTGLETPESGARGLSQGSGPGQISPLGGPGLSGFLSGLGAPSGGRGGPNQSSGPAGIPSLVGPALTGLLGGGTRPGRSSGVRSSLGGNPSETFGPGISGEPSIGGSGVPTGGASGPDAFGSGGSSPGSGSEYSPPSSSTGLLGTGGTGATAGTGGSSSAPLSVVGPAPSFGGENGLPSPLPGIPNGSSGSPLAGSPSSIASTALGGARGSGGPGTRGLTGTGRGRADPRLRDGLASGRRGSGLGRVGRKPSPAEAAAIGLGVAGGLLAIGALSAGIASAVNKHNPRGIGRAVGGCSGCGRPPCVSGCGRKRRSIPESKVPAAILDSIPTNFERLY